MQFSEYKNANSVKDRRRYELNSFRGVDTTSAPSEVSPTRATYMRNFENRDGINHKRFGWKEDYSQKQDGKVNNIFEAEISGKTYKFIHCGNKLNIYCNGDLESSENVVNNGKSYAFYSNEKVYFFGLGNGIHCFYLNDEEEGVFESLIDSDNVFIPTIYTNINKVGTAIDYTEALDSYNLMTHYVKLGLVGEQYTKVPNFSTQQYSAIKDSGIKYKCPISFKYTDGFKVEIETLFSTSSTATKTKVYKCDSDTDYIAGTYTAGTTSRIITKGDLLYYQDLADSQFKFVELTITPPTIEKRNAWNELIIAASDAPIFKLSDGHILQWIETSKDSGIWKLSFGYKRTIGSGDSETTEFVTEKVLMVYKENIHDYYEANGTTLLTKTEVKDGSTIDSDGYPKSIKFKLTDQDIDTTSISNLSITYRNTNAYSGVIMGCNISGVMPVQTAGAGYLYNIADAQKNPVGIVSFQEGLVHFFNVDLDAPIAESSNITITAWDNNYSPSINVSNIDKAILFGTDGACDRIFATLSNNPNMIIWSGYSDDPYMYGNAFSYFADTEFASIGATQNKITGMTRLNDSTLAIFRERMEGENDFTILSAEYEKRADIDTTTGVGEYAVKITSASANMPQTAINNDCFGALASDVLFASKMGVYAISISTGTSVERYAIERSDPIANMFADLKMETAKAIVYRNKYYLAVKYKEGQFDSNGNSLEEDLVLVADARFSYKLDRNMDDTFNYEWYIWSGCPVQKWFIENDQLCFYDYDGRKCTFTPNNYYDRKYNKASNAITDAVVDDAYTIDPSLKDKTIIIEKGLLYKDTSTSVTNPEDYFFKFIKRSNGTYSLVLIGTDGEHVDHNFKINTALETIKLVELAPVQAIWFTPTLDLGASDYMKTAFMLSIGLDHKAKGQVYVGWKTKYDQDNAIGNIKVTEAVGFDFSNLDFNFVSFGSEFDSSYTTKLKLRDFTYLQLFFGSTQAEDIAVNNLVMLYKYNKFNRGNW